MFESCWSQNHFNGVCGGFTHLEDSVNLCRAPCSCPAYGQGLRLDQQQHGEVSVVGGRCLHGAKGGTFP